MNRQKLPSLRASCLVLAGLCLAAGTTVSVQAADWWPWKHRRTCGPEGYRIASSDEHCAEGAGNWYWMRSPEQEQRVVASLYNRYCIRCHGVDGRGVWDIPDVPDLTNDRWQATRSDEQFTRAIIEGRGAVMPAFRGTLTLEESWAMARYLRSFVPGSEASRPDTRKPETEKERRDSRNKS